MDGKIKVPEGMLTAGNNAVMSQNCCSCSTCVGNREAILEAALLWLDAELKKMYLNLNQTIGSSSEFELNRMSSVRNAKLDAIQEVRRMFLAPEPEEMTVTFPKPGVYRVEGSEVYTFIDGGVDVGQQPEPSVPEKKVRPFLKLFTNAFQGVTLTPQEADYIVDELNRVTYGWNLGQGSKG